MAVKVKVCGITNQEDAVWAATLGAQYVGFNFSSQSPRKVSPDMAKKILEKVPPFVTPVGVFVEQPVAEIVKIAQKTGLKGVQLHGEQTPDDCRALAAQLGDGVFICQVFRVAQAGDLEGMAAYKDAARYFLIDARVDGRPGGTGQTFPWSLVQGAKAHNVPLFIAGGLTPENVGEAVEETRPFAVDVASGVEKSPKRKDYDKLKKFIEEAKNA